MRFPISRSLILRVPSLTLLIIAGMTLSGCFDERKPLPVYQIVANADGSYQLEGRRFDRGSLLSELRIRADDPEVKRVNGPGNRAYIRLIAGNGVAYGEVQDLVNDLTSLGYNHIERP